MGLGFLEGARESVSNLGGTGNVFMAKVGSAGVILGKTVFYLMIAAVVFLFLRKALVYNRQVYIFKRYATGLKLLVRKGRFYRDKQGNYKFLVTKSNPFDFSKKSIPVTDQEYFISTAKSEAIFLLQVGPDDFKPIRLFEELIELTEEDKIPLLDTEGNQQVGPEGNLIWERILPRLNMNIMDLNASNHALALHKEIVDKHRSKSKLMFYAPMILFVLGMFVVLAALWITLGRIETMNSAMTNGYSLMADAIKDFGKQIL